MKTFDHADLLARLEFLANYAKTVTEEEIEEVSDLAIAAIRAQAEQIRELQSAFDDRVRIIAMQLHDKEVLAAWIEVLETVLREAPRPLTENRSPFAETMRAWREKHLVVIAEALRDDKEEGK